LAGAEAAPGSELRNSLERAAILAGSGVIRPEHLILGVAAPASNPAAASKDTATYTLSLPAEGLSLDALHEQILAITLERCNGNKAQAAKLLKIGRSSYYR
ncbi:MAG: helix-turn-helix domain-containing protein, partial [Deltaproteobacteria bacterium]